MASDLQNPCSKADNTTATDLAFERVLSLADDSGSRKPLCYPKDATFIPADLPTFGAALASAIREERPVIVIYPDGTEKMIVPRPASRTRSYWFRLLREHLVWRAERSRHV